MNYQCADCHSTNLRKGCHAASNTYGTTYAEIDVGCEACHGPGTSHVAWAKRDAATRDADATRGLTDVLDERRGLSSPIDAATGNAVRSKARSSVRELETCAQRAKKAFTLW